MMMEKRIQYIVSIAFFILVLSGIEALFVSMLVSPTDTITGWLLLSGLEPLYTVLSVLIPVGIIGLLIWLWYLLTHRQGMTTYGTAHFATRKEIQQTTTKRSSPKQHHHFQIEGNQGTLYLGTTHHTKLTLSAEQLEGHVLIVAPTKRGKTAGTIIPNLLLENGNRSLFINDVKYELVVKCAGRLAQHCDCYVIAPTRQESNGYNPLAHVRPESLGDARNVAECLVRNTGSSKEPFWDNAARLLLTAVILHLRATEPQAAFSRIADVVGTCTLPEIRDLLTKSPSPLAKRVGASFIKNVAAEPKLQANIMTDMATRLFDVLDPQIEQMTATNDLDFQRLGEKPSALFLHIPPHEADRLRWLSSCLIMQLINYLFEHQHKQSFVFYLDELANAGYIPKYLEYISYIRTAGVVFLQVVQDFSQLERIYEAHGKETIIANSNTKVFLSGVGQVEAEYASRVMGDTTVMARSQEERNGRATYSEAKRSLMNPDEIRSLPMWSVLVLMGNTPPIIAHQTPYFEIPELAALANLPYTPPVREHPTTSAPPSPTTEPESSTTTSPEAEPNPSPLKQQSAQHRGNGDYFTSKAVEEME